MMNKDISTKLRAILEINKRINSFSSLSEIIESILQSAIDLLQARGGSLLLVDETGKYLKFESVIGDAKEKLEGLKFEATRGIAGYVFSNRESVISNNTLEDPRFFSEIDRFSGLTTKKIIAVPLVRAGTTIGVIEVINTLNDRDFTSEDLDIMNIFSEQASIAITNAVLLKQLNDKNKQLSYLYEISSYSNKIFEEEKLFSEIVRLISELFEAERVSIMMYDQKVNSLVISACVGIDEKVIPQVMVNINEKDKISAFVFNSGEYVFISNMDIDKRFGSNKKLRYKTSSFVSIPVKSQGKVVGVLNVTELKGGRKFEQEDIELLLLLSNQIGLSYEAINAYKSRIESETLHRELEIMRRIQMDMLPKVYSVSDKVDAYFYVEPFELVGGDFFDIYTLDENRICFFIGDVSGKGMPASLFMAASKFTIKAYTFEFEQLDRVMNASNMALCEASKSSMFSTLFICVLDTKEMVLQFSNAGHNQQFLVRENGDVVRITTKGLPLGMFYESKYSTSSIKVYPNDIIVSYTDGISELENSNNEMFGDERIVEIVRKKRNLSSEKIVSSIIEIAKTFKEGNSQTDDITIGIVKIL